jgi:hypothetical protein
MKRLLLILMHFIFATSGYTAFDLLFVIVQNEQVNDGIFDVQVQIKATESVFRMGTSNLVFEYNTAGLAFDSLLLAHNFNGYTPPSTFYNPMTVTAPYPGWVSVNIDLATTNLGTEVGFDSMEVATIRFKILDVNATSDLRWRARDADPNPTVVYADNQTDEVEAGELAPLDVNLPVELTSFSAEVKSGHVILTWVTESEIDNMGFNVYRSMSLSEGFERLNGSMIRGAGTTTDEQVYSYIDTRIRERGTYYYKLEQIDIDGNSVMYDPIEITISQVVIPTRFFLEQNFPNPFNPRTSIRYGLPEETDVKIQIFNMRGELVRTLVDTRQRAGEYDLNWDTRSDAGIKLPSGLYFYRLDTDHFRAVKKMILTK